MPEPHSDPTATAAAPVAVDAHPVPESSIAGRILRFLGVVFRQRPFRLSLAIALSVVVAVLEAVAAATLVPLLELVNTGAATTDSQLGEAASAVAKAVGIQLTLETVLVGVFLLVLLQQVAFLASAKVFGGLVAGYEASLRQRLYDDVFSSSWAFFLKQKAGNIIDALTVESQEAGNALSSTMSLISHSLVTVAYLAVALVASWQMTLITLIGGVLVAWMMRGRLRLGARLGSRIAAANADLQGEAMEAVAGAKLIKASGAEPVAVVRFTRRTAELARSKYRVTMNEAFLQAMSDPLMLVLLLIGIYVSVEILNLPFEVVVMILFVFYRVTPRVAFIQKKALHVVSSLGAFARIEALETESRSMGEPSGDIEKRGIDRELRLDGVSFSYGAGAEVLRDVSLTVPHGSITAIVGPSGAGKSTIADLVMALVRPDAGRVMLDDTDAADVDVASWRSGIGYVTQDAVFFHASVRENLTWTAPEATDEEIGRALRAAYADEFVAKMPGGLDGIIGDRGVRMSGGQRQRLALARAFVRKPSLLILDEATSALDAESEERISEAVRGVAGSTTVLVITHRLASVKHADRILFLEDGRVVESGSYAELVAAGGRFKEMMELQELGASDASELVGVDERP